MRRSLALSLTALVLAACADSPSAPSVRESVALDPTGEVTTAVLVNATGDYTCVTSVTGSFENIIVPDRATCTVSNATITGNVLAKDGARLRILSSTTGGDIQGAQAALVHILGGRHAGSVQVQEGSSPTATGVSITGGATFTNGNVSIEKMTTGSIVVTDAVFMNGGLKLSENVVGVRLSVLRNRMTQNLEVIDTDGLGAKTVTGNRVSQKIECLGNTLPFVGRPNAALDYDGQCTR